MTLYTNSRLRVLRDCIARHHYQYQLQIRTPSTYPAQFGTAVHAALEAYLRAWKRGDMDARLSDALATIDFGNDFDRAKLRALVIAYHLRWGACEWDVLEVEAEFRYDLDDALIGGKLDGLIRDRRDGKVYVLEHKCTGSDATPGSSYWEKLAIDTQVSIYVDGATVMGYEIAGCIYDVLKRPEHEQLKATPIESRRYTKGKGCSDCGGSAGGKKGIVQGKGKITVAFASEVKVNDCTGCKGTGWRMDDEGVPQTPRLDARQRDADETAEEFEDRLAQVIGERVEEFLIRNVVVRLDDELPRMRDDLLATIALERVTSATKLYVKNTDACARYGAMCPFFGACSGRQDINDTQLFPRNATAHPELATAA